MSAKLFFTRELIAMAAVLEEGAFVKRYPRPVLVFNGAAHAVLKKAVPGGLSTVRFVAGEVDEPGAATPSPEGGSFEIEPLVPKKESPFADLVSIGRTPANDLVVDHPSVSKTHALFWEDKDGGYWISDEGSTNGTYVQGVRLLARKPQKLAGNELIGLGDVILMLKSPLALYRFLETTEAVKKQRGAR